VNLAVVSLGENRHRFRRGPDYPDRKKLEKYIADNKKP